MKRFVGPAAMAFTLLACGGDDSSSAPATTAPTDSAVERSGRCVVRLHGKGGDGAPDEIVAETTIVSPSGNDEAGDGRQWLYFPEDRYAEAVDVITAATEGCEQVIIDGFSNGGSFAAKLYCRGETLGGRLVRVVIDDPVVDSGVVDCSPAPSVGVALYWTGALESTAVPGWDCEEGGWTCEGGTTIGIDAYAAALGTEVLASPFDEHEWYLDAPELAQW